MARGRAARGLALALFGSLLVAGCSDGDGDDDGGSGGTEKKAAASGKPTTPAEARALIEKVIATPELFGPDVVRRAPYENDPTTWPVLGKDCAWGLAAPPRTVLATLTRNFELPAANGKGSMRLAAIVTVHRTARDAEWEMAESLEEGMRCPDQQLRTGERITGMFTSALAYNEATQLNAHDVINEYASHHSTTLGGPYPYVWMLSRNWQITTAVTGKAGKGRTDKELGNVLVQANAAMLLRLQAAVTKPDGAKSDAPKPDAPKSADAKPGDAENDAEGAR